jgi:hypothetical protein
MEKDKGKDRESGEADTNSSESSNVRATQSRLGTETTMLSVN